MKTHLSIASVALLAFFCLSSAARAQTVTFTFNLQCVDNCPPVNLSVAVQQGQVASDLVSIASVNSDVAGYTNPVPINSGSLNWVSSPATYAQCDFGECGATYGNPGGSASITGSVFGLPPGSTLFTASFLGGATSGYFSSGSMTFRGGVNISYINPVLLANLGLAGKPTSGYGILTDYFYSSYLKQFQVSVTYTTGTLDLLHSFTGGPDGANPYGGLTMDASGNLYGTASRGGAHNGGTAFKLTRAGSGWTFNPLYSFGNGPNDGWLPEAKVVIGPDGALYGTTYVGGENGCGDNGYGCGTVFKLQPPVKACKSALCPWTETVLYRFTGYMDGANPASEVVFDTAGNLYGTTLYGGDCGGSCGTVYQLKSSGAGWTEKVLYRFTGDTDGSQPMAGVAIDQLGNLYGTTTMGGDLTCSGGRGCGTVFQLMRSGSNWQYNALYAFHDGNMPALNTIAIDQAGNLYGAAFYGVYSLSVGSWNYNVISDERADSISIDNAGNLYGMGEDDYGHVSIFKLTLSNGNWIYGVLYDFTGRSNGAGLFGNLVVDSAGSVYGTASDGGANDDGVVFRWPPQ
jgi:uncharacterized repeat protein (TIGR03803 family)